MMRILGCEPLWIHPCHGMRLIWSCGFSSSRRRDQWTVRDRTAGICYPRQRHCLFLLLRASHGFNPSRFAGSIIAVTAVEDRSVSLDTCVASVVPSTRALRAPGLVASGQDLSQGSMGARRGALPHTLRVKGPSPVRLDVLEQLLIGYPNREAAALLSSGFKEGFRIPTLSHRVAFMADNLKSVKGMEVVVARKIGKEAAAGRVAGPFNLPPFDNLRVSPLGVVPKKAPGEYRRIHHLSFLGIELDTVVGCSHLPLEKLTTLRGLIGAMQVARKVSLKELQVVVGHLNFACRVVVPGRAFLRRLCDLMSGLRAPHHRVRLTEGVKADLAVWGTFLEQFNGVSFWRAEQLVEAELQVHSDAAGGAGFGVYFRGRWCYGCWPVGWERAGITRDLTFLELFPIVVAVHLWAGEFSNSTVQFWCDNQAVVQVVNSQTSRSPRVMGLVRAFVLQCLRANILFVARHVPGLQNDIADALSRFQLDRFRELAPEAMRDPEVMPEALWRLGA
ncbi:uncharacterized protein LOC128350441 isoform X1 [Hemicordylus capensis]|uniref:uncharacterized protein LOC128350441 isoform X1 n=1 Tax=Hemicordylus capensis TaxID=884348 RepID=UPI00230395FB|nr:uncharacterized protein LOC128350441 isoform X1 [Hemicordylus capensis]